LIFLKSHKSSWIVTNEVSQTWLNINQKGENYE